MRAYEATSRRPCFPLALLKSLCLNETRLCKDITLEAWKMGIQLTLTASTLIDLLFCHANKLSSRGRIVGVDKPPWELSSLLLTRLCRQNTTHRTTFYLTNVITQKYRACNHRCLPLFQSLHATESSHFNVAISRTTKVGLPYLEITLERGGSLISKKSRYFFKSAKRLNLLRVWT